MMMEKLACLSLTEAVALRNSPTILQMMLKDAQCEIFSQSIVKTTILLHARLNSEYSATKKSD